MRQRLLLEEEITELLQAVMTGRWRCGDIFRVPVILLC